MAHEKYRIGLVTLAGCIAAAAVALLLDLPGDMARGEQGRQAIQMLDEIRHPLLAVKDIETRLLRTRKPAGAQVELAATTRSAEAQIE